MKLLHKLTIKSLKLNKKRTIVTIIGIVLATALITSIATLVSSAYKSYCEYVRETDGNYHVKFNDVPTEEIKNIENKDSIENLFLTQKIGYSIYSKDNEQVNIYFQILGFSENAMQELGIKLVEGRMPENENEIVISQNNIDIEENANFEISKEVELNITNEEEADNNSETTTKNYKIVGIIDVTDENIEKDYMEENNITYSTIITTLSENTETYDVYVRYKNVINFIEETADILGVSQEEFNQLQGKTLEETSENLFFNKSNKYTYTINSLLTIMESGGFGYSVFFMIYAIATIVMIVIIISSVFCIRNSFSISITEKIKEYGMLSSIGATKKQIRQMVFYEAFILGIIAIPIGILLGTGLIYLFLKIGENLLSEYLYGIKFIFSINIWMIILSVVLSIITIYFSASKSAKKASQISPIEAIRNNENIDITNKTVKSSKIIKRMFGVGGDIAYKNLKRNKKRYRTTVISIVVSVSIFIGMSSFVNYVSKIQNSYYNDYQYNVLIRPSNYKEAKKTEDIIRRLGEKRYIVERVAYAYCINGEEHYSKDLKDIINDKEFNINPDSSIDIYSLGNEGYNDFIKELGLKYEDVKDKAILIDYKTGFVTLDGNEHYKLYRMYDYEEGDTLEIINVTQNDETLNIEIAEVTDKRPMNIVEYGDNFTSYIIVSDEMMDNLLYRDARCAVYINSDNDRELEEKLKNDYHFAYVGNIAETEREEKAKSLTITIFLYSFIVIFALIGITNIFNTITTSMELRQREFANLKAIGMTNKEFNHMIALESLFYILKSLVISIPIGIILSYIVYQVICTNIEMNYIFPIKEILIVIIILCILIGGIMKYSLNKTNKQNIIETIRKENI